MKTNKKKKKTTLIKVFIFILFIFDSNKIFPQAIIPDTIACQNNCRSKFEFGGEYLMPTRFSDKIQTISIHSFFWKQYFKDISLMINVGITTTYAWGYTSYYRIRSDTAFKTDHKTSAFGMGPALQIDYAPIKIKNFSVVVEASGGFILYSNHFPYGGDVYNFMFRAGPSLTYKINKSCFIKTGYRWMHVSNGKGYGKQNPFYEAQGINLGIIVVR